MAGASEIISLNGIITVTENDRRNQPLEIAIETDDFQTYVITGKQLGKELFNHISEKITLSCQVEGKNYYGLPMITILEYAIHQNGSK